MYCFEQTVYGFGPLCYELSTEKTDNSELIARKEAILKDLKQRYDNFVEMRAEGAISKEAFYEKTEPIQKQITAVNNELADLAPARYEPIYEDYEEKITFLRYALDRYTYPENEGNVPPYVIEALIEKIVVTPHEFKWYLRFGKENKPIDCEINGKRAENCSLSVDSEEISPTALEQYRQLSKVNRTDLFLRVGIGYDDALKHRKSTGKYLRPYQWEDLTVEVYI